jgi:integrase
MGLAKRASTGEYTIRPFGFHSLRRYLATYLSDREKVATKTIQEILGHTSEATTERYFYNAHRDLEAVMELLEKNKGDIEGGNKYDTKN